MDQSVLPIGVDDEHTLLLFVKGCTEVHCDRAFADAALLLRDRYDFRRHVLLRNFKSVEFYIDVIFFSVEIDKI
ncbi:hypothetical protein [Caballeronia catudaia]|uniref:hypothetical protein n=1 Tax=Caballeronia catudaia TaxID=1777136 RepID=UPI001F2BB06F|nr:hypothetical protein [Caballeronia catudaia]